MHVHNDHDHGHDHDHHSGHSTGAEDYDNGVGNQDLAFGGDAMIDAITRWNASWGPGAGFGNSGGNVRYSFSQTEGNGYIATTAAFEAEMVEAFRIIAEVADISFQEVARGDLEVRQSGTGFGGVGGWSGVATSDGVRITGGFVDVGGVNLALNLHEIGHAIGLAHPGEYNGSGSNYADDAAYWDDTGQYTLMSYWEPYETGGNYPDLTQQTLMLYDVAALQRVYGANTETRAGDTVYGFNSNARLDDGSIDEVWRLSAIKDELIGAVWDAGGTDIINIARFSTDSEIDLREGGFSSFGGLTNNFSIAFGVVIENASTGSGNDHVIGNSAANAIRAGRGHDVIEAGDGDDIVFGSGGADRVEGGDGADRLHGGNGKDTLLGDAGIDRLFGGGSNDRLDGGDGNDRLVGGDGLDRLIGGRDHDDLYGQAGNDVLIGNIGWDMLSGGGGDDRLFGHQGRDTLIGGGGDDVLSGGRSSDVFVFAGKFGDDIIVDFETGRVGEFIDLSAMDAVPDFADLSENHLQYVGEDALISIGANSVIVQNVGTLSEDDFIF